MFDPAGVSVVLRDRHGAVRSTVDMTTDTATPCVLHRADGTPGGHGGRTDGSWDRAHAGGLATVPSAS